MVEKIEILKDKKIGVLMGGMSKERDISIKSGKAVHKALIDKGYNSVEIDVGRDIDEVLKKEEVDVAFITLHGKYGEDGVIQGVLEMLGIPYTGSGVMSSAMAMDKGFTKKVLMSRKIATPEFCLIDEEDGEGKMDRNLEIVGKMELPIIVKPVSEGSTIGISIVKVAEELKEAVETAFRFDNSVMAESYIEGREFTVSVMDGRSMPVIEIRPKSGFYDFESKYNKGKTEFDIPAEIDKELADLMSTMSVDSYKALDCRGAGRVDLMVDKDNKPFVIEVNTIPGMTELSLLPMAAGAEGVSYEDLVEKILISAVS